MRNLAAPSLETPQREWGWPSSTVSMLKPQNRKIKRTPIDLNSSKNRPKNQIFLSFPPSHNTGKGRNLFNGMQIWSRKKPKNENTQEPPQNLHLLLLPATSASSYLLLLSLHSISAFTDTLPTRSSILFSSGTKASSSKYFSLHVQLWGDFDLPLCKDFLFLLFTSLPPSPLSRLCTYCSTFSFQLWMRATYKSGKMLPTPPLSLLSLSRSLCVFVFSFSL